MRPFISISLFAIFLFAPVSAGAPFTSPLPTSPFDEYGEITWENEMARLDNFAVQLQNVPVFVGYIFVYDGVHGCAGEAQARAIRAKRYLVEYRGIAWNQVIWRPEGHLEGRSVSTVLIVAGRNMVLPRPFLYSDSVLPAAKGETSRVCQGKLRRIRMSKW